MGIFMNFMKPKLQPRLALALASHASRSPEYDGLLDAALLQCGVTRLEYCYCF